jgi:hypothetical protein
MNDSRHRHMQNADCVTYYSGQGRAALNIVLYSWSVVNYDALQCCSSYVLI